MRIPIYNKGQGPRVGLATGQLSQRASSAAFEAPGRAMASLGETVSNIANQFGMAEKKAQAGEAKNEAISNYVPQAQQLIDNPKSSTVSGFDIEAGAFKKGAIADIDSRTDLTRSQRAFVKDNLSRAIDSKLAIGRAKVFTQQQAQRKNQAQTAIGVYIDEAVSNKGLRPEIMSDINNLILDANNDGLNVGWTIDSVGFEIDKREILSETTDTNKSISYFEGEKERTLKGEGRGKGRTAAEIGQIANLYESHISYLKGPLTAQAKVDAENALASIRTTGKGADKAAAASNALRQTGQYELANDVDLQASVAATTFDVVDNLTFASPKQISDQRDILSSQSRAAAGTDLARQRELEVSMFDKAMTRRKELIAADPASYVVENFKRKFPNVSDPTKGPTKDQIITAQSEMGLRGNQIKVFTVAEVNTFSNAISQAQTPEDVTAALAAVGGISSDPDSPVRPEVEAAAMRQLRAGEFKLALNYVANAPDAPMSKQLLSSAQPGNIKISVTPQNRDLLNEQVRTNGEVKKHLNSMLGGLFVDFQGDSIRSAAADTQGMRDARQQHIDMISNLAVFLIQEDGKSLSGDNKVDATNIQGYIDQAATIFDERYSYIDTFPNKGTSLRLPKYLQNDADFIEKRLNLAVAKLGVDDVYYRSSPYAKVEKTYDMEKDQYLTEVKTGFGWIISSDGSQAILVDRNGGAVFDSEAEPISKSLSEILSIQAAQQAKIQAGKSAAPIRPSAEIDAFDVETF